MAVLSKKMTPRQKELYDFLWGRKNWRAPDYKAMADYLGVTRQAVLFLLKGIKKRGFKLPKGILESHE